jgi:hypothetical protein
VRALPLPQLTPPTCDEAWTPVIYAVTQPEYLPLPGLRRVEDPRGMVSFEFELSEDELGALVHGGHLRLTVLTFNRPLQPIKLEVVE